MTGRSLCVRAPEGETRIKKRSLVNEVVAVLEREPLCVDCLAGKVAARREDVARALNELRRAFRLSAQAARCAPCGSVRMTYRVTDAPFVVSRSTPPAQKPS